MSHAAALHTAALCRWRRARTEADAEKIRLIRNETRLFMTRRTEEIGFEEQRLWFQKIDPVNTALLLFESEKLSAPLGYGLLHSNHGWTLSGAVTQSCRGMGLGRKIFETLIEIAPSSRTWLEVREDNTPARKLYESLHFVEVDRSDRPDIGLVLTMVRDSDLLAGPPTVEKTELP